MERGEDDIVVRVQPDIFISTQDMEKMLSWKDRGPIAREEALKNNIDVGVGCALASEVVVGFVTYKNWAEGVLSAKVVEEFVPLVVDSALKRSIGITSDVDESVGVRFAEVINSSLEEC